MAVAIATTTRPTTRDGSSGNKETRDGGSLNSLPQQQNKQQHHHHGDDDFNKESLNSVVGGKGSDEKVRQAISSEEAKRRMIDLVKAGKLQLKQNKMIDDMKRAAEAEAAMLNGTKPPPNKEFPTKFLKVIANKNENSEKSGLAHNTYYETRKLIEYCDVLSGDE